MRIVFMGTPDFSVPILVALALRHEVVAVYSQPPRPAGRGKAERKSPVQLCAEELGLPVRHPVSLRTEAAVEDFAQLNCDVAVVVAYGLILPPAILQAPRFGCLNIHASLLPRWRGAAPIHRAILAGDAETGICIMQMDEGLDTGAILLRQKRADKNFMDSFFRSGCLRQRFSGLADEFWKRFIFGAGGAVFVGGDRLAV